MIRRLLLIIALGVATSGCFMAPIAFVGPVTSGFSSASIIQTGITSGANFVVKKSTGKSISEHAIIALNKGDYLKHSLAPSYKESIKIILPKTKTSRK